MQIRELYYYYYCHYYYNDYYDIGIMITPYKSEDPKPAIPTHWKKEEKMKTIEDENEQAAKWYFLCSYNKPVKHHTTKYRVRQIVPPGFWERNKSLAVMRGSIATRRISTPIGDKSIARNPHWRTQHR